MNPKINKKQSLELASALKTIMVGIIVLSTFSALLTPANAKLSVPLTIQEALPGGVSGLVRTAAPVTVGLPLPEDSGITNVNQLGLSGVTACQFRPLAWWPNGNIRWVLTDFQADLAAGQTKSTISLTDGTGNTGGSNLAIDGGATITINTGTAQFVIRKASFNVFDSVVIGGQTLVTSGNAGRVSAVGADGTVYTSANDASSTAVIEENGPLRTVIKATGILKNSGGVRLMDYTLRISFFRGKSEAKAAFSLRNASKLYNYSIAFKSAEVIVPVSLSGAPSVKLALKTTTASGPLTESAVLQQGFNNAYSYPYGLATYNWDPPIPGTTATNYAYDTAFQGLNAQIGSNVVNTFGTLADWSQGFAQLYDARGRGLSAAIKDMRGYWPVSFEIKDSGEFSIEPYGKWSNKLNKLPWGKYTTREWMWNFESTVSDPVSVLYDIQYPVLARAPLSQYAEAKAFGQKELATPAEDASLFSSLGKSIPSLANAPVTSFYRAWAWSVGGGTNQMDFALADLYDYLRTGNGVFWKAGEQHTLFQIDAAVKRSDDYTTESVVENTAADPMPTSNGISGGFIDMEHAHVQSLPLYYFITGNELAKDAFIDYCELMWRTEQNGPNAATPLDGKWFQMPNPYLRAISRKVRNMAVAHDFTSMTGNNTINYKTDVEKMINIFIDSRENILAGATYAGIGRNMARGYLYWDYTLGSGKRVIHSLFHPQMLFDDLWQVRQIMLDSGWNYERMFDFEDFLSGMSLFFLKDYVSLYNSSDQYFAKGYRYGYIYDFDLDAATPAIQSGSVNPYDSSRAAVWAYQQTGDKTLLDIANNILYGTTDYETKRRSSGTQGQHLIWAFSNKILIPIWQNVPVTVSDNGGGSYTLSWTVPTGATKIQIKYSDKTIVEWLGFDKFARTYQYDPAQYTAFFAAKNITNNPTPDTAGMTQSITLTGLPAGQKFAMKSLVTPPVKPPAPVKGFVKAN